MWFLHLLSYLSLLIQIVFITISLAAGLYYLAELVEEHTVLAKQAIYIMISTSVLIYIGFIFFESFSWILIMCGLAAQISHYSILQTFPSVRLSSASFIAAVILLVVNHYLAFTFFASTYHPFSQVVAYFILCLWLVPFALFVSLSANDNVLPTVKESSSLLHDNDVVSHYFSRNGQKPGLLTFFNKVKDSILPQTNKKSF
ncbi:protein TEX261 [Ctenocephalides felis]|uniref:protein TEX261 n=1 Tax=Ctenocephalides felis TaxID=7515 RepID=UPI000E6E3E51|nr:protein TEX261 [Ctenocephalides felis]